MGGSQVRSPLPPKLKMKNFENEEVQFKKFNLKMKNTTRKVIRLFTVSIAVTLASALAICLGPWGLGSRVKGVFFEKQMHTKCGGATVAPQLRKPIKSLQRPTKTLASVAYMFDIFQIVSMRMEGK